MSNHVLALHASRLQFELSKVGAPFGISFGFRVGPEDIFHCVDPGNQINQRFGFQRKECIAQSIAQIYLGLLFYRIADAETTCGHAGDARAGGESTKK